MAFIAEVRRDIVTLHGQRAGNRAAFNERAHHGRRTLRAQRDGTSAFVLERVHFLLHYVRRIADAAYEKLRMLKRRETDLTEIKRRGDAAERFLKIVPLVRFRRQHVVRTLRRFDDFCHNRYLLSKETGQMILPFLLFLGFTTSRQLR